MRIRQIDTMFLWVTDLDRAVAWYREHLGIEPGPRYGDWQVMSVGGETVFALHQGSGDHESVNAVVGFRVDDLDALVDELGRAGIDPIDAEVTNTGAKRFTTYSDPDGNHVQLIEQARGSDVES